MQQFYEERKRGIGGSDASAVLGVNPYKSAIDVFLEKTGQIAPSTDDTPATYWGKRLEPIVREEFQRQTGLTVMTSTEMFQSDTYPFMIAHVDGFGRDGEIPFVLECKTTHSRNAEQWTGDVLPIPYMIQVAHYLFVTGAQKGFLAVLIGGNDFRIFPIDRDADVERLLLEGETRFWTEYVQKGILPPVDGSLATANALQSLYATTTPAPIELTGMETACAKLLHLKQQRKAVEQEELLLENQLKAAMQSHEMGTCGEYRVTWKPCETRRLDVKNFQAQQPDMYARYLTSATTRRFQVTPFTKKGESL